MASDRRVSTSLKAIEEAAIAAIQRIESDLDARMEDPEMIFDDAISAVRNAVAAERQKLLGPA